MRSDFVRSFLFQSVLVCEPTPQLRHHVLDHSVGEQGVSVHRPGDGVHDVVEIGILLQVARRAAREHVVDAALVAMRGEGDDAGVG